MSNTTNNLIIDMFLPTKSAKNNVIEYNAIDNTDNISEITTSDLKYARDNIANAIELGRTAASELSNLAGRSQDPETYEVLNNTINVLLKANHALIDLHTKNQKLTGVKEELDNNGKGVTQNLFVGSTKEMLEMMETLKNK